MSDNVLQTRRLDLRRIAEDDLDAYFAALNTPRVMERLGDPRSRAELAEKHVKTRTSYDCNGFGFMLAWERETGDLVAHWGMERRPDLDFTDPTFPAEDSPTIQYSLTPTQWERAR